jgi:hypothetical protein
MSRQVSELQTLLTQLTMEHRKLLEQMDAQHAAMKKLDLKAMAELLNQQESGRLRINALEVKRRALVRAIAGSLKMTEEPKLTRLAEMFPQQGEALLKARSELREIGKRISQRAYISSKLAGGVLGHLNTVVRLLAGAVERAGLYTRRGVPRVASRIGVMEAVG